ncbi:MAG: M28 family peptidase, partial [Promethearchaeota archaeon]
FVSFGSEEGGMKGSKYFAKQIKNKILNEKNENVEYWVVNFDSIASKGPLLIATSEPLYRCKYLPDVYRMLEKSAKKASVNVEIKTLMAGTDSAPFGRLSIPATGIVCMGDGTAPTNWHSIDDTPENLEPEGIINSIKLGIQFIIDLDQKFENK